MSSITTSTSSSSNVAAEEANDSVDNYKDPLETLQAIGTLLQPHYQRRNTTNKKSNLLTTLFEGGNISHGALKVKISQKAIRKFKKMLMTHFFNNLTSSGQLKRDAKLYNGQTPLNYNNFKKWCPEFVKSVIDKMGEISYVNKRKLHYNATLTYPSCHGTKHPDMMDFLVRLIFTFLLSSTGEIMTKHFSISHPDYDNGKQHAMAIGCHEFVVLDSKSSGSGDDWKQMMHQAKAPNCEVLTTVVSVPSEGLPAGLTLQKFMEDLRKCGLAFETVDHLYTK